MVTVAGGQSGHEKSHQAITRKPHDSSNAETILVMEAGAAIVM
jgi:hypothetical protein